MRALPIKKLALGASVAYVALCAVVGAGYRAVLFPAPRDVIEPSLASATLLRIPSDRGEVVALHAPAQAGEPTIVYFHGNGEDLADSVLLGRALIDLGVGFCAVEYPGYGLVREQRASEESLYAAAEVALAELERRGVDGASVVLVGQSLGSGVATELASRGRGAALVLIAPFTSIPAMARRFAPFLPVDLLVRDKLDNLAKAPRVAQPSLVIHGDRDELVPFAMGRALAEVLPRGELFAIEGGGHNDLFLRDRDLVERVVRFARASTRGRAKLQAPEPRGPRDRASEHAFEDRGERPERPAPSRRGLS